MDNPKTLDNLLALIDSGKEENLEMALQLSVNLPPEWKWIRQYLQSKKRLPKHYNSWYAVYADAVKYDHERFQMLDPNHYLPTVSSPTCTRYEFHMNEIHQNVALELHWELFRANYNEMITHAKNDEWAINNKYGPHATKSKAMPVLFRILELLPRNHY